MQKWMGNTKRKAKTRWIYQIPKDIKIRGENLEEMPENRKWENRTG